MGGAAAFDLATKLVIVARSEGKCERCGRPLGFDEGNAHHRRPRGIGGTSDARLGLPSNGLRLCSTCHDTVESHRGESYGYGWLVRTMQVPSEQPVKCWDGWAYLNDDGTITRIALAGTDASAPPGAR